MKSKLRSSFWALTATPNFGNCYTFNSHEKWDMGAMDPAKLSLTGAANGRETTDHFSHLFLI